jgi:hypothetical protein
MKVHAAERQHDDGGQAEREDDRDISAPVVAQPGAEAAEASCRPMNQLRGQGRRFPAGRTSPA